MVGIRLYLVLALLAFLIATTGSDVFARMYIGGQPISEALSEHFYWAGVQLIGTVLLFLPFGFLAVIGSWLEDKTSRVKGLIVFALPALYLMYSYFDAYQASKVAELDKRWTTAALTIGFQPFAAAPVVLLTWLVALILVRLARKHHQASTTD